MSNVLQSVAQTIIEVLEQMALDAKIFTAYNVTEAVRDVENQKASPEKIYHNDVRSIVENEFVTQNLASYDRELCTLNVSGNPQAFVYFPDGKLASDHPLVDDGYTNQPASSAPVSGPTGSIANHIGTVGTVDLDDDEFATTKEGRVQIPRKLTSQVTPNSGTYDVIINGTYKGATADARGDIRVCLKQFGITDSKVKVTVDTTANSIKIETV